MSGYNGAIPTVRKFSIHKVRRSTGVLGSVLFLFLVMVLITAALAPWIAPHAPDVQVGDRLLPPLSDGAILGTDTQGRDILTRLLFGARISLMMGVIPVMVAMLIGTVLGLLSGYYRSLDSTISIFTEVFFAFPPVLLAVSVAGTLGASVSNAIVAISLVFIPYVVRVVREAVLSIKQREFIEAALALGQQDRRILLSHILPNVLPTILAYTTSLVGQAIVAASGLSFLGLGVQAPSAEWGLMVSEGKTVLSSNPMLSIAPGLLISFTAIAFIYLGHSTRRLLATRL